MVLACRSLLSGLAAGDRLSELRIRAGELPKELASMFAYMLGKVEERYRVQTAKNYCEYAGELEVVSEEAHHPDAWAWTS